MRIAVIHGKNSVDFFFFFTNNSSKNYKEMASNVMKETYNFRGTELKWHYPVKCTPFFPG